MFESLNDHLQKHVSGRLSGQDARHVLQHLIREKLRSDQLYCVSVDAKQAIVRVGSVFLQQELLLWKADLLQQFVEITGTKLKEIAIQR